jgi:hypothetical protein
VFDDRGNPEAIHTAHSHATSDQAKEAEVIDWLIGFSIAGEL